MPTVGRKIPLKEASMTPRSLHVSWIASTLLFVAAGCSGGADTSGPASADPPAATAATPAPATPAPATPTSEGEGAETTESAEVASDDPGPITQAKWKSHPRIVEVRELVGAVLKGAEAASGEGSDWKEQRTSFVNSGGCGDQFIYEVSLLKDPQGKTVRFHLVEGAGDISAETSNFYDPTGVARFVMSEYRHSSAESNSLSRLYLNADGTEMFAPAVEQLGKQGGPQNEKLVTEMTVATSAAADAEYARIVKACSE